MEDFFSDESLRTDLKCRLERVKRKSQDIYQKIEESKSENEIYGWQLLKCFELLWEFTGGCEAGFGQLESNSEYRRFLGKFR